MAEELSTGARHVKARLAGLGRAGARTGARSQTMHGRAGARAIVAGSGVV